MVLRGRDINFKVVTNRKFYKGLMHCIFKEIKMESQDEWEENYKVHEIRFSPDTGFFSPPDRLIVVGQLDGQNKNSIMEMAYNIVEIKYQDGIEPRLTLHKRDLGNLIRNPKEGEKATKILKGVFELPTGYNILGLKK